MILGVAVQCLTSLEVHHVAWQHRKHWQHYVTRHMRTCMNAGCVKKAGDLKCPDKLYFLSFMVMELLGPSVGYFSLERQTYTTNTKLLVSHGLGMLKVRTCIRLPPCRWLTGVQECAHLNV